MKLPHLSTVNYSFLPQNEERSITPVYTTFFVCCYYFCFLISVGWIGLFKMWAKMLQLTNLNLHPIFYKCPFEVFQYVK